MGQLEDPEQESEVLKEATEFLIQQAIRVGDDEDDAEDALDPLQPTSATGSEVAAAFLSDKQERSRTQCGRIMGITWQQCSPSSSSKSS